LKKGQLQIQESVFVLFIVFLIMMIGMIVFFQYESRSIQGIMEEAEEDSFFYMISFVPSMSELKCSRVSIEDECIDLTKAKGFSMINDSPYHKIFGNKKIVLNASEEIVLYDWNPHFYSGVRKISSPVSVHDVNLNRYLVGVLEVYMYEE